MAKRQKSRVTLAQFDQALIEEIAHTCLMNVPLNAVVSAALFTVMVSHRLFGKDRKHSDEYERALQDLIEDTRRVRAEAAAQEVAERQNRVIIPGRS